MSQVPRIVFSELSQRWYVVTRYRERRGVRADTGEPSTYIVATTKHDVTDQMHEIFASRKGRPKRTRSMTAEQQETGR